MADFKPDQNDYTNLTPFKTWLVNQINTWGINNFPFLESDFDKLTNYGMLMKMMKCLNDIINNENLVEEDMSNIFQAFTELQTYINNYFDNLDVQEEINNKLDDMASSGELTQLIKAYIDPLYQSYENRIDDTVNNQNNRLAVLEGRMDEFSTLPPGSTSGNAELVDIRVGENTYVYDSAGNSVRNQIKNVDNNEHADLKWRDDLALNSSGNLINNTAHTRIMTRMQLLRAGSVISVADGYKFAVALYNSYSELSSLHSLLDTYVTYRTDPYLLQTDKYVIISLEKVDESELEDLSIKVNLLVDNIIQNKALDLIKNNTNEIHNILDNNNFNDPNKHIFRIGSVGSDGTLNTGYNKGIVNTQVDYFYTKAGGHISINNGYVFKVAMYDEMTLASFTEITELTRDYIFNKDTYFKIFISYDNPTVISTDSDVATLANQITVKNKLFTDIDIIKDLFDLNYQSYNIINWFQGYIAQNGTYTVSQNRACVKEIIDVNLGYIYCDKSAKFSVVYYDENDDIIANKASNEQPVLLKNSRIKFSIGYSDDHNFSVDDVDTLLEHFHIYLYNPKEPEEISDSILNKKPYYSPFNLSKYFNVDNTKSYNLFNRNTTYADYITEIDTITNLSDVFTKTDLGVSSDNTNHLYLYKHIPSQVNNLNNIPKIFIVGGQHGFEKNSPYAIYYFMRELTTNWKYDETLEYLFNNAEIWIIPVVNPYGFNNYLYKNANGVNTNRNFPYNWVYIDDPSDGDYGGTEPLNQPETQAINNILINNSDFSLLIDFHTKGGNVLTDYDDITWVSLSRPDDDFYNKLVDVSRSFIKNISTNFIIDYNLNTPIDTICGEITRTNTQNGVLKNYALYYNNIVGLTLEGFPGFPTQTSYNENSQKANTEILINFLRIFIDSYQK